MRRTVARFGAFLLLSSASPVLAASGQALTSGPDGSAWVIGTDIDAAGNQVNARLEHYGTGILVSSRPLPGGQGEGFGIAFDAAGEVFVSGGYSDGVSTGADVWKLDSAGQSILASSPYLPPGGRQVRPGPLAVDSAGHVWVPAAEQTSSGGYQEELFEFDSNLAFLSSSTYQRGGGIDGGLSAAVDGAGSVWVAGASSDPVTATLDLALWKYNSSGQAQAGFPVFWPGAFGTLQNVALGLTIDRTRGRVWVATRKDFSSCLSPDFALLGYDLTGALVSSGLWHGSPDSGAFGQAIALDGSGNVYAVGQSNGAMALWAFSSSGTLTAGYPQTGAYNTNAVGLAPTGQVAVLSGDAPQLFQPSGSLAGASGPSACALAGQAYIAGTVTYAAGFTPGAVVNLAVSGQAFLNGDNPVFHAFTAAGGTTLPYSVPVAAPSTYSVVAVVGDPHTLAPGAVLGSYRSYAPVASVAGSTTSAVDFPVASDVTPPSSALTSPASNSTLTSLSALSGTAADNAGVGQVDLAAQDLTNGLWWDSYSSQWISTTTTPLYEDARQAQAGTPAALSWSQDLSSAPSNSGSNFGGFSGFLINGHQYRLYARARDFANNLEAAASAPSLSFTWNGPSGLTAPPPPPFVQGFALGVSSIGWTWGTTQQAASYTLADGSGASLGSTTQTSFTQTGLVPGSADKLCVTAVNAYGASAPACSSAVYTPPATPGAPTLVAVTSTTISIAWTTSGNDPSVRYQAVLATSPAPGSYVQGLGPLSASTATFTSLAPDTSYYAAVVAVNAVSQQSDFSPVVSTRTPVAAPGPVSNLAGAALGVSSIAWTWSAAPFADSYVVTSPTGAALGRTSGLSFDEVGLSTGAPASLCVQAQGGGGGGPVVCGSAYAAAAAPGALSFAFPSPQGFSVSWDARGNDSSVIYEVSVSSDGFALSVSTPVPFSANQRGGSAFVSGLAPGTTYFARVRARSGGGLDTDFSPVGQERTLGAGPDAPTLSSIQADAPARLIRLSWQAAATGAPAVSFTVFRGVSPDTSTFIFQASTAALALADPIMLSATYFYQVAGVNSDGIQGARSNVLSAVIDVQPPQPVGDLRFTARRPAQGQADLAWTAPADDFSGVARYLLLQSASFDFSSPSSTTSIAALAPGATVSFTVTVATTQAAYFAVRSVDAAGNVSLLSNSVVFDPVPPNGLTSSLADGQVVSRPLTFNASASDNVGVTRLVFRVDGSTVADAPQGFLSFAWDTRSLPDGAHAAELDAYDAAGNETVKTLSFTMSYAPPSPPSIAAPSEGFGTAVATIAVSGYAENGVGVDLQANNLDLATATVVNGSWSFNPARLPAEGDYALTAIAFESRGFSAPSSPVHGVYSASAPNPPQLVNGASGSGGASVVSWSAPVGKAPTFYRVYRSTDDLLLTAGAKPSPSLLDGDRIAALSFTETPAVDDLYFYGVTSVDGAGNESALSDVVYVLTDRVPPTAAVLFSTPQPVGPGLYTPRFAISETLSQPPIVTFTPRGGAPIALNLTGITATLWRTTVTITADMGEAPAQFAFQGTDLAGNVGTALSSSTLLVDTVGPSATASLSRGSPMNAGPLTVTLTLNEPSAGAPALTLTPQGGAAVPLTLTQASTDATVWTAAVNVSGTTGDGQARLDYRAADPVGNASTLLSGTTVFVIDTVAPPAPAVVRANALPNAVIALSWSAGLGEPAAYYNVYRDGVKLSTRVVPAPDGSGFYLDSPGAGQHQHQVSAVDLAGNESAPTDPVSIAKGTPPSPPVSVTGSLNSFGQVEVAWQAGSTDTVSYKIYRTTYAASSLAGIPGRPAASPFIDAPPADGDYHYVVTALDSVGNESAGSVEAVVLYPNGAPVVTVSGVADGAYYAGSVSPAFTAQDLILDTSSVHASLNGQSFVSGSTVSAEGAHTLTVSAASTAGHATTVTTRFTIDLTAPRVSFSVPGGALLTSTAPVSVQVTASDLNLAATAYTLVNNLLGAGGPYDSGAPITRNGQYALTAVATDLAGNSSTATLNFSVELGPIAPTNLTVQLGSVGQLSWTRPEPDVAGYRVYKDGVRISAGLNTDPFFTDAAVTPGAHVYEVSAVDSAGVEGARARASVPAATLGFNAAALTRGYFDALHPTVSNAGAASLTVGPASLTVADAAGNVAVATAPAVSAAAGASAQLEGVIATPVALGPATLHAVVQLPTDPGASVSLAGDFPVSAADPVQPLLEVLPGPLVPGTLSPVQVRLYNRGTASMDVVTAQVANSTYAPVDDVQVLVETPQGTVLAASGIQQTDNGANAALLPGGRQVFFVTIPPGQSELFDPVQLAVPNTVPQTVSLAAVVSTPTFSLPFNSVAGARSFASSAAQATVSQIPYRATVRPDRQFYDQGSSVTLTGRAIDTISGFNVPNVSVAVHVINAGFDRTISAVTDSTGNYTTAFFPLPNEAGVYALSASHPAVIDRVPQATFTIVGMAYQYTDYTATLAQNSTYTFTVDLTNTGGSAVTGLTASSVAVTGSGVTLTVDPATLPSTLAAGAKATLNLSVSASVSASTSTLSLVVTEAHGFSRVLPITAIVVPAQVIPSVTPQQFEIGMLGGDSRVVNLVIANKGFDTWRGVTLTNPALSWVTIQGAASLGDIPPGGNVNVSLQINPPVALGNGTYSPQPLLQITSLNVAPVPVLPSIAITSSRQGDVQVSVINADKPRSATGQGVPVSGAKVTLTSLDVSGLAFTISADLNGLAQFTQVPSGNYAWRAEAQGFQTVSGTAVIEPGLVNKIEALLPTATVTYAWTVTPTTIQDQYNIALNLTFNTDVPAPAIVIDPPLAQIDLDIGQSAYGQYTLTNKGLVSVFNYNLTPLPDDGLTVELPFTTIPELKPGQSVVVPYKVTYVHHSNYCKALQVGGGGDYPCAAGKIIGYLGAAFRAMVGPQVDCGGSGGGTASSSGGGGSLSWPATVTGVAVAPPAANGPVCNGVLDKVGRWLQNPHCGGASPLDGSHSETSHAALGFPGSAGLAFAPVYSSFDPPTVNLPPEPNTTPPAQDPPGWLPPAPSVQMSPDGSSLSQVNADGSREKIVALSPLTQNDNGGNTPQFANPVNDVVKYGYILPKPSEVPQPLKQTTTDGTVTKFQVYGSSTMLPVSTVDRNGNTLTYQRDGNGTLLKMIDNFGRWIAFSYNAQGQMAGASDSAGRSTSYGYDAAGNKTSETDVNGDVTRYGYDANHRMTSITYPNGGVMSLVYDAQGRVASEHDDGGVNSRTYSYYASSTVVVDGLNHSAEYDWTEVSGRRKFTRIIDAAGGTTLYSYDANFNLASVTDALGRVTQVNEDALGEPTSVTDPAGGTAQATYDPFLNEPTSITDPKGNKSSLFYDAAGNLVQFQDPAANMTQFSYDKLGHLTAARDAFGNVTTLGYDAYGAVTSASDPLGRSISLTRDALSRVTQFADPANKQSHLAYDPGGDVTQISDPSSHHTAYAYQAGRTQRVLASVTDANNHATTFNYDSLGRFSGLSNAMGQSTSMSYDANNNPTSITMRDGRHVTLSYDNLDRVTSIALPEGAINLTYDAAGQMLTAAKYNGTALGMTYDSVGRVTQLAETLPNGYKVTLTYSFDANGNRTGMSTPWGSFAYTYDALDRLTSITNRFGQRFAFAYDALSRPATLAYPNGIVTTYAYDKAGQVTQIVHQKTANQTAVAFDNYTYDSVGNVTSVIDADGTHTFTYDNLDQLISATHSGTSSLPVKNETFTYDAVGNRSSDALRTGYTYDTANRIQSDSSFIYTTDANGNVTSRKDRLTGATTSYVYDSANQMVEVDGPGGVIATYKYDPPGNRVERTANGTTLRYVYDKGRPLAILDANNNLLALMTEGPGIDAPLAMRRGGSDYFYHEDALGDVTALTDINGNLLEAYAYQAFGRGVIKDAQGALHDQSTVGNPYSYSARECDPETDYCSFRARTYDPDHGRFLQEDPVPSLNQYVYAENSPSVYFDPMGTSTAGDIGVGCRAGATSGLSLGISNGLGAGSDPCSTASKAAYGACKVAGFVAMNYAAGAAFEWAAAKVISGVIQPVADALDAEFAAGRVAGAEGPPTELAAAPQLQPKTPAPDFVVGPDGTAFPVPKGATGPVPVINEAGQQTGSAFVGGAGGKNGQVSTLRMMSPTEARGNAPAYPNGYIKYENAAEQGVDPYSGRTGSRQATHFKL